MESISSNSNTTIHVSSFTFTSPIKLDRSNYTIQKSQILSLVRANGLEDHLDSSNSCLDQFLQSEFENSEVKTQTNLAFTTWKRKDQMLLSWMLSSINLEILSLVVNSETSLELWTSLDNNLDLKLLLKRFISR